jgi:hypothetical protein
VSETTDPDPRLVRRARIAKASAGAKRLGYLCLLVAFVCFFVGLATDFPTALVTITIVALAAACVILPLPIVLAYGVKAADRADLGLPDGH